MAITAELVKKLRDMTGAGMLDCKNALVENNGDIEASVEYLRKKGIAKAAKKADRETKEGIVYSYIHHNEKVGVLLLLGCETDFVAKTEDFHKLAKDIALQIASMNPKFISREKVPAELIEKEKEIFAEEMRASGKPDHVIEKIVSNKIESFYKDNCLLEQEFALGDGETIQEMITAAVAKIGENIAVEKFERYAIGQ
jgi:elongation factor Ts